MKSAQKYPYVDRFCSAMHVAQPVSSRKSYYPREFFYSPSTLYQLLTGLLWHMRDMIPGALNFLEKGDQHFKALHNSLDSLFRDLRTNNIGTSVKHAEVFTRDEEQIMWNKGILGTTTPQSLLKLMLFSTLSLSFSVAGRNIGSSAFYKLFSRSCRKADV